MNPIFRALKATYNFFAGDAIILAAVVIAFGLVSILANAAHVTGAILYVLFIAIVVGGLVTTLGRELAGHK